MSMTNRGLPVLLDERAQYEADKATAVAAIKSVNEEITAIAKPLVDAAMTRAGKVSGSVNFAQGDVIYKGEVDKSVKWDSAKLFAVAAEMPWSEAKEIFKFELSVGEKIFAALPEGPAKEKIKEARTVTYSDPKVSATA